LHTYEYKLYIHASLKINGKRTEQKRNREKKEKTNRNETRKTVKKKRKKEKKQPNRNDKKGKTENSLLPPLAWHVRRPSPRATRVQSRGEWHVRPIAE
jgi:hypothetical protein